MEAYVVDWLNLLMRWLHVITGIAWIGSSFYFVWLDNHLEPYRGDNPRVFGEIWSVHGGGFYHNQKYMLGPEKLPATLHWFKWEAYSTWLSGMGMLAIVYWWGAGTFLIDRTIADLSVPAAIAISAASLVAGWLIYDALCRFIGSELLLGSVVFVLLCATSWGFHQIFGARAAYLHTGAVIGTIMVWNVYFIVIPGQRKMVDTIAAGGIPDPKPGAMGKQRSIHNNYFTLPVLFIMLSSHYPMTYGNRHGWLVLAVISAAGVMIRHFFNLRHKGKNAWPLPALAVAMLVVLAALLAPARPEPAAAGAAGDAGSAATMANVQAVIAARCLNCHSATPKQPGFAAPPGGVMFDTAAQIRAHAPRIYAQSVAAQVMPPGNLTGITAAERALIGAWISRGAPEQ
ncbi:MAG: hypothetical protein EXR27_19980 [Betaproteobacteria bacterium]|nr:hypothetical protein [Betaproteobacteria bacterium]